MPAVGLRDEQASNANRNNTQLDSLDALLAGLPAPGGPCASAQVLDLTTWSASDGGVVLDWMTVPPICDPVRALQVLHAVGKRTRKPTKTKHTMLLAASQVMSADLNLNLGRLSAMFPHGSTQQVVSSTASSCSQSIDSSVAEDSAGSEQDSVHGRALRKRWQVDSFAVVLKQLLPTTLHISNEAANPRPPPAPRNPASQRHDATPLPSSDDADAGDDDGHADDDGDDVGGATLVSSSAPPPVVVDFGCGSGGLLLPLAAALPHCCFVGVEMRPAAVALVRERAVAAGLTNVEVVQGMIEDYSSPFTVALALHACGNATDYVMIKARQCGAAVIVSPCCIGKLKFSVAGGSSFSAESFRYTPRMPGQPPPGKGAAEATPQTKSSPTTITTATATTGANPYALTSSSRAASDADDAPHTHPPTQHVPSPALSPTQAGDPHGPEAVDMTATATIATNATTATTSTTATSTIADGGPTKSDDSSAIGAATAAPGRDDSPLCLTAGDRDGGDESCLMRLHHPRSQWMTDALSHLDACAAFKMLAKAADSCHSAAQLRDAARQAAAADSPSPAAACPSASTRYMQLAAAAKLHVELDRLQWLREGGYVGALYRCFHADVMAHSVLLVAVPQAVHAWKQLHPLMTPP